VTPQPFKFETARPKPALRHADAFRREPLPRPPSYNERNVSDKPSSVANKPSIGGAARRALTRRYRCELATLLAVDEGVARINATLEASGIEDRTVVIFTTDNGYMHGEHRVRGGKVQPYEEAIRLPFLIKGPGIPAGRRSFALTGDVDLVPTLLEFAGLAAPPPAEDRPLDGVSVRRALRRDGSSDRAILLEAKRPARASSDGGFVARSWVGVRTRRYTYIEHRSATVGSASQGNELQVGAGRPFARELYDNKLDPYQLKSRHAGRRYAAARRKLARVLAELEGCSGRGCVVDASIPGPRAR
jgi:arylsulfatase A-like enzyme